MTDASGDFERDRARVIAVWNRGVIARGAVLGVVLVIGVAYWIVRGAYAMAALWVVAGALLAVGTLRWHRARVARLMALDPPAGGSS